MEDYQEKDELLTLTCFHKFHAECIAGWFKSKDNSPVCRVKIAA